MRDVVVDRVLVEVVAFDEQLRVIDIFEHGLWLLLVDIIILRMR